MPVNTLRPKEDLALGTPGHAPEATFRSVPLLLFNLLAEFQQTAGLMGYREPVIGTPSGPSPGPELGRLIDEGTPAGQHLPKANPTSSELTSLRRRQPAPELDRNSLRSTSTSEFRRIKWLIWATRRMITCGFVGMDIHWVAPVRTMCFRNRVGSAMTLA
jgi:hypothetical protein